MKMSDQLQGIKVPPIVKKLSFSDYTEGLEQVLWVWVNITNAMHEEYTRLQVEGLTIEIQIEELSNAEITKQVQSKNDELQEVLIEQYVWYSTVWSKHKDKTTHETPGQVQKFAEEMVQHDPALWKWVTTRTQAMILAHRNAYLKNYT
jgi:hypothetical protein